jgi:hypothetical protein
VVPETRCAPLEKDPASAKWSPVRTLSTDIELVKRGGRVQSRVRVVAHVRTGHEGRERVIMRGGECFLGMSSEASTGSSAHGGTTWRDRAAGRNLSLAARGPVLQMDDVVMHVWVATSVNMDAGIEKC